MPNPNAFIAIVSSIEPSPLTPDTAAQPPQHVSISFDNGQTVQLDINEPRWRAFAEILEDARRDRVQAFVEVDPRTQKLTRLFFPHVARVTGLHKLRSGDVEVRLRPSAGRHVLNRSNPDFDEILAALTESSDRKTVLAITETPNEHEVIDARPLRTGEPNHIAVAVLAGADATDALPVVTAGRAKELFELVQGKTCDAIAPHAPCIPFLYPDDGCWARAHEMCRLIEEAGDLAAKIWNYAPDGHLLETPTANNPACGVSWSFHVAPVIRVMNGGSPAVRVIDPALFDEPVSVRKWTGVQRSARATHVFTDQSVFDQPPPDRDVEEDRSFRKTRHDLAYYRLLLKSRARLDAPPPFKHCLTRLV